MTEHNSYTVHDYSIINKHVDEEVARDHEITRLSSGKVQRRIFHNISYILISLSLTILICSIAFWVYRQAVMLTSVYDGVIVDDGSRSATSVAGNVLDGADDSGGGLSSRSVKVIEKTVVIEKKVPVPVEVEVDGDKISDFTIFSEKESQIDGIDKVITGSTFHSSNDNLPYTQWCYTRNSRNNVSSTQVKLATKDGRGKVVWHDISSDDAKQYGATVENLSAAKDFCSFIHQSAPKGKANITPDDRQKVASSGTGFFIGNDGFLVTNEHVISMCSVIWINRGNNHIPAEIIDKNSDQDLAILKITQEDPIKILSFSNSVYSGQDVIAFGFPLSDALGGELKVTKGNISAMSGIKGNPLHLQFTAPIQSGNSGGPLLDTTGAIAGMNTSTLRGEQFQNINFAIKGAEIQSYLGKNGIQFQSGDSVTKQTPEIVEIANNTTVPVKCY